MPQVEAHTQRLVGRWESVAWMESHMPPILDSWAISRWYTRPVRPRRRRQTDERQLSLPLLTSSWMNYFHFRNSSDRTGDMLTRNLIAAQQQAMDELAQRSFDSLAADAARYWTMDTVAAEQAAIRPISIRATGQVQAEPPVDAPDDPGAGVASAPFVQVPYRNPRRRLRGYERMRTCTRPPCRNAPSITGRTWRANEWAMHIETIHHECSLCGRPFAECRCQEAQGQSTTGG